MWERIKRISSYLWRVLVEDRIPVWLTLFLMCVGAVATYGIAPAINQKFEVQAARREFLVRNLEEFSTDTKSLLDVVYKGLNETDQRRFNSLINDASPKISKLQFSATQLLYVVPEDAETITKFQKILDELQDDLIRYKVDSDSAIILQKAQMLMRQSLEIYEILLSKAGLGNRISLR